MNVLIVVNQRRDWPMPVPGANVITAREYLTDTTYSDIRPAKVLNLCRTNRYQGRGYYVSLLAEARGHRPLPEVKAIGDLQSEKFDAVVDSAQSEQIQRALAGCASHRFTVEAYFGRDPLGRNDALARLVFSLVGAPLLRATFERRDGAWHLNAVRALTPPDVPAEQRAFVADATNDFVMGTGRAPARESPRAVPRLAILFDETASDPPSNRAALDKFMAMAKTLGMQAEFLRRGDIDRIPEFDALFIRDTTSVNHYTYQFARRAAAEGLQVIDDPDSIVKCSNKVYLNELLSRHRVPVPNTLMVHRGNVDQIVRTLGLPCIVKQPDGAFSLGVAKIESEEALREALAKLFAKSDLVIAQQWLPTEFDWRVGVFDRRPLFVCKYFMAPGHWQIVKRESGRTSEGSTLAMAIGEAPEVVIKTAVRAANLIGDGLYGVDLKQDGNRCYVMEINDNPNIDAGNEDAILQGALYREILGVFLRRIREPARRAAP